MKHMLVVIAIWALSAAWADDKAKSAAMPKLAPEARELRAMAGTWKTTDTFEKIEGVSPGGEGTSIETIVAGPGGLSIIMNIKSATGPMPDYRGTGILAWNPEEKEYRMAFVQNAMAGITFQTGHKQGNDIVMQAEAMMNGKKVKSRDVMSDRTPSSYTLTTYLDDGSGEKKVMTIRATKAEAKKAESR